MGYVVKHSTSNVNKTRRKGNVALGVSSEGYDKTATSGFYAGVPPVEGKHNLVKVNATSDPDFYCVDDTELINLTNSLGGGVSNVTDAIAYLTRRSDIVFTDNVNNNNANVVTDELLLDLDARNKASFVDNKPTINLLEQPSATSLDVRSDIYNNVNKVDLGGGKFEFTNDGTGSTTIRLYCNLNDLIDGETYACSVSYEKFDPGDGSSITLDWCDVQGVSFPIGTYGEANRISIAQSRSTYNSTYRFFDISLPTNASIVLFDAQVEKGTEATDFTSNSRSQSPYWYDISRGTKPLSEIRVLGAHHVGYNYPPFINYFITNCNTTLVSSPNDITASAAFVKDNYDLVVVDEYVWAMSSTIINNLKSYVDEGVSCIAVGNDQRGTTFVDSYTAVAHVSHDIVMSETSKIGLSGKTFNYGSGDVYGGINSLTNGAEPLYYRADTGQIMGYLYENTSSGACLYFDQEGLQNSTNEIFRAAVDYVTKNITYKGTLVNGPTFNPIGGITFDGTDDIVDIPTLTLTGSFSITQTMNLTSTGNGPMPIGGGYYASGSDYRGYVWFRNSGNDVRFKVNGETGPNFSLSSTKWVDKNISYTVTRDGTTAKLYLNGVEEASSTISTNNFDIRTIGASYNYPAYSCDGTIYSTKIYGKALSQSEILQNYYGGDIVTNGLILALDGGNLVSYEQTGSTLYNLTDTSVSASIVNGAGSGSIISLDGTNDWIGVNNSVTSSTLSPSVATFSIWFRANDTYSNGNTCSLISRGNYNTSGGFFIHMRNSSGNCGVSATFSKSTTNSYMFEGTSNFNINPFGEWNNVTVTVDDTLKLYTNGVLRQSINRSVSTIIYGNGTINTSGDTNLAILSSLGYAPTLDQGAGGTWRPYNGDFGNMFMYNRVLSSDEVLQNYNAQKARFI